MTQSEKKPASRCFAPRLNFSQAGFASHFVAGWVHHPGSRGRGDRSKCSQPLPKMDPWSVYICDFFVPGADKSTSVHPGSATKRHNTHVQPVIRGYRFYGATVLANASTNTSGEASKLETRSQISESRSGSE